MRLLAVLIVLALLLAGCSAPLDDPLEEPGPQDPEPAEDPPEATEEPAPPATPDPQEPQAPGAPPAPADPPQTTPPPPPPGDIQIVVSGDDNVLRFGYAWDASPTSIRWWFGDGQSSVAREPTHRFDRVGTYEVRVVAKAAGYEREATTTVDVADVPLEIIAIQNGASVDFAYRWGYDVDTITWDLGDGTTRDEADFTHEYVEGGPFEVSLAVGGQGNSASATRTITFDEYPLDISAIRDRTEVTYSFTWGWEPDVIEWRVGDGTIYDSATVVHNYADGGTQVVRLHVEGEGHVQDAVVTVPVPRYPLAIEANSPAKDNVWDFGFHWDLTPTSIQWTIDGATNSDETPQKVFDELGTYPVKLEVSDGLVVREATQSVTVANLRAIIDHATLGLSLEATVTWLDDPDSTTWSFGDGATSTNGDAMHRYTAADTYTLRVDLSKGGLTQSATVEVTVEGAEPLDWGDPADKALRPGIRTYEGGQCTSNFLFTYHYERYFLGSAAHCVAAPDPEDPTGGTFLPADCSGLPDSIPLGTPIEFEDWRDQSTAATGNLFYSSWGAMTAAGETETDACRGNDFALYEVAEADWDKLHPAMLGYGGPTGGWSSDPAPDDPVYAYGSSGIRSPFDFTTDENGQISNAKRGTYVGRTNGVWSHEVFIPTDIQGDSGSGLVDQEGRTLGALSGGADTSIYTDITRALAYMAAQGGLALTVVTWDDFNTELIEEPEDPDPCALLPVCP